MIAWVHGSAELTRIAHTEIELSLSHLKMLLPERGFCCVGLAVIAFCLVAARHDARLNKASAHRDDPPRKWA